MPQWRHVGAIIIPPAFARGACCSGTMCEPLILVKPHQYASHANERYPEAPQALASRWMTAVSSRPWAGGRLASLRVTTSRLAEYELIAFSQQMVTAGRRPATVNHLLDALRPMGARDQRRALRPAPRTTRNRPPLSSPGAK